MFAYLAQCRCDPAHTTEYFTLFYKIVQSMPNIPQDLQLLVVEERSRMRYTQEDLQKALECLGFGPNGNLRLDYDDEVPDDFVADAWRDRIRRAWREPKDGSELQREANDAFRIVAESRGSASLRKLWEDGRGRTMNPDRAYSTLEIPTEVDDAMLLTVYMMRVGNIKL